MAQKDWKPYYAPIMVHRKTGECRIWHGKFFRDKSHAFTIANDINSYSSNYRVIGIGSIRGKKSNPQLQKYLSENSK
jgi:hypothetical protein